MTRGEYLAQKREERKLSQTGLAIKSKVNVRMIQEYEQGRRNMKHAKAETIKRLAKALSCSMEELIQDDETDI